MAADDQVAKAGAMYDALRSARAVVAFNEREAA